ncbi:helix-turn-helix transcriptional regulator [Amycolatopsis sp. VS8301801F10]|uniref:helix-turn-helix transcriptional regulator n=1 Tax=Amycolatopsis sp. VS8301801F10 TaxID=2652442 RepID=UPI0038FCA371
MIDHAVNKALQIIHERYSEHLTVASISEEIFVSPFYFSRAFQKVTGTPPSRYLKALRQFAAKRLLMTTSLTVSDVVAAVGYASVGTFSSRFLRETGMTPTQLRDPAVRDLFGAVGPGMRMMPSFELTAAAHRAQPPGARSAGAVTCTVSVPAGHAPADVIVGVFDTVVPQGAPVACAAVRRTRSAEISLGSVPAGRWHLIALAGDGSGGADSGPHLLGVSRALCVRPGRLTAAELALRPPRLSDPPIATVFARPPSRLSALIPAARAGDGPAGGGPWPAAPGPVWTDRVMSSR